ncbi:hypothetical protein BDV18DRAFT_159658 [Aspergillus unguis]
MSLTVYRGALSTNTYVWSPFVTKLEARLRFASVPYKTAAGSVNSAPKGKIPYIDIADNEGVLDGTRSTSIGDSTLIIKHLVSQEILPDLNESLAPTDRASDLSLRALLEDKTSERWTENYYTMRDTVLSFIPYPMRVLVGLLVYRKTLQTLNGQGTGRYSDEEIQEFRVEAWSAVNEWLVASKAQQLQNNEERLFWIFGGQEPSEADAVVFGFVVSGLVCDAGPKMKDVVKSFPVVVEYATRIHDTYFPDYERWDE